MKRLVIGLLLLLVPMWAQAASIKTAWVGPPEYTCDGLLRTVRWFNPETVPAYVTQVMIWTAIGKVGSVADASARVFRMSDGMNLAWYSQEKYADPEAPHQVNFPLGLDMMVIQTGDGLAMDYFCNAYPLNSTSAQHVLLIYYRLTP